MASGGLRCEVLTPFEKTRCGGKRFKLLHPPPFAILYVVRWRNFLFNRSDYVSYRGYWPNGNAPANESGFFGEMFRNLYTTKKILAQRLILPKKCLN